MSKYHFGHWYEWPENEPEMEESYLLAIRYGTDLLQVVGHRSAYGKKNADSPKGWYGDWGCPLPNYFTVVAFMPLPRHPLKPYPPLAESFAALRAVWNDTPHSTDGGES